MLDRIAINISNVVMPVIDVIDDATMKYNPTSTSHVGGFSWQLQFKWHQVPAHEKLRWKTDIDPIWYVSNCGY